MKPNPCRLSDGEAQVPVGGQPGAALRSLPRVLSRMAARTTVACFVQAVQGERQPASEREVTVSRILIIFAPSCWSGASNPAQPTLQGVGSHRAAHSRGGVLGASAGAGPSPIG